MLLMVLMFGIDISDLSRPGVISIADIFIPTPKTVYMKVDATKIAIAIIVIILSLWTSDSREVRLTVLLLLFRIKSFAHVLLGILFTL